MSGKTTMQTTIEEQMETWKAQVAELSKKIADMKAKAEELEDETKQEYLKHIKDLENKIEDVKAKLAQGQRQFNTIKDAGEEALEDVKTGGQHAWQNFTHGVSTAWTEVKTSFDQASSKLEDKIPKK